MSEGQLTVRLRQTGPIPLNVDLTCRAGELMALVGPSGSGKTTVLRAIAGLYQPREGRIACNGTTWLDTHAGRDLAPHRRRVGLVFQSYALFPHMTALDNVAAAMGHRPRAERLPEARRLLGLVNLTDLGGRRPAALSGGQQQRVALARALARDPDVLLLDEPFTALDRRTRRGLHNELQELRLVVTMPIVLVTHDMGEAQALADSLCVLDEGDTLQVGSPAAVLGAPASARVRHALDIE